MRKLCLIAATWLVLLPQLIPADTTARLPELNVAITDAVVRVDGRLDELCWHRPPDATEFQVLTSGKPASPKTEVWLARDNARLFIAFRCQEPRVADIKRDIANRDGSVHHDDSIEVFISPGSAGETYGHFLLNAAGVQGDNRAEAGKSNIKWDGHWRSAVCVDTDNNEWTAELAGPLFYLAGAAGDGEWTG